MPSHRITLYYITLHYKPLHNITLPYKALHTIAYHTFTWYYIALHCIIITYVKHRHTSVLFTEIQARKESLDAWRWIKTKHSRAWRCFAIDCLAPRPITKRAKDWTHKAAVSPPSSPEIMKCVPTSSNRCAKIFRCADAPRFSISKALCNWLFCHFSWAASAAETCHKKKQSQKKISAIATTYFWARCMLRGVGPFWCEIRTVRCWRVWLVTSVAKCHPEIFHVQPSFRFNRCGTSPTRYSKSPTCASSWRKSCSVRRWISTWHTSNISRWILRTFLALGNRWNKAVKKSVLFWRNERTKKNSPFDLPNPLGEPLDLPGGFHQEQPLRPMTSSSPTLRQGKALETALRPGGVGWRLAPRHLAACAISLSSRKAA